MSEWACVKAPWPGQEYTWILMLDNACLSCFGYKVVLCALKKQIGGEQKGATDDDGMTNSHTLLSLYPNTYLLFSTA